MSKRVVVIASGGLDSTTIMAMLLNNEEAEYEVWPMNFNYGQRHSIEQDRFAEIMKWFRGQQISMLLAAYMIELPRINCLLTSDDEEIPEGNLNNKEVAPTYVPGRNTIFIAHALSYAENIKAEEVYIGVNALDYSGYPDCRPEFIEAMNRVAEVSNDADPEITIRAPLLHKTKAEIIAMGVHFNAPYHLTWSCYKGLQAQDPFPVPCGVCDSCKLRAKGFKAAGIPDPAL